ncbi:MAG: entericidin, EcnA/B family [Pseudomonadota bacterium]
MRLTMRIALLGLALLGLAACNTLEGVGQDISAGARAIDRAI